MSLTTEEIMQVALELAGLREVPPDSGVYVSGENIRRVLFGIDITPAELMLAGQMRFDAVIAHHPMGAQVEAWKVYLRHVDQLVAAGVPEQEAREAVSQRIESLALAAHSANYDHLPSVARLMGMPYMNIHLPADEVGRRRMQEEVDQLLATNPQARVAEVVEALYQLGEFRRAATRIQVRVGSSDAPAGRTVVSHGAYSNGGYGVAAAYFRHGVGTVACIHIGGEDVARLRKETRGNLIAAGHVAGDSVGINVLIAELERRGLEVTRIAGVLEP